MSRAFCGLNSNSVLANVEPVPSPRSRLHGQGTEDLATMGPGLNANRVAHLALPTPNEPSTALSAAQSHTHQQATFKALTSFLVDKISPAVNVLSANLDSAALLTNIKRDLAQLTSHLNNANSSPYSNAERQEQSFQTLIHRCSEAGPLYTHVSQTFEGDKLKAFAQLLHQYTQKILQSTNTNAQASVKSALVIFPPVDDTYHCTGGTINRLIIAQHSLDTGPEQLLLNLFQEAQQRLLLTTQQFLDKSHEIHIPPAILFLMTGDAKQISTIDSLFRSPFEAISTASAWQAYSELYQAIPNLQQAVTHIVKDVRDLQAVTLAEAALVFSPWQLEAWDEDGISNYPTAPLLENALYQQLDSTLWSEQARQLPWQLMSTELTQVLPEYSSLQGAQGYNWLIDNLQPQAHSPHVKLHEQALHALFLMTESLRNNNPAQALSVLHDLGPKKGIQNGLKLLEQRFPDQALRPVLQRIKDRVDFYCRTPHLPKSKSDTDLIQLHRMIQGEPAEFKALWKAHFKVKSRTDSANKPTLMSQLARNNCADAIRAIHTGGASDTKRLTVVNSADTVGKTPLHKAAQNGHVQAIAALHSVGAKLDPETHRGETPLYLAANKGHRDAVKQLLALNAKIVSAPDNIRTPMYAATQWDHAEVVTALIEAGADPNKLTGCDDTPLLLAARFNCVKTIQVLVAAQADVDQSNTEYAFPLFIAALCDHSEAINALLTANADIDKTTDDGATALCTAAEHGNINAIQALVAAKADLNKPFKGGLTPVFIAVENGHIDAVRTLIAADADLNQSNDYGMTPLYAAAERNNVEVMHLLLASKADTDASNNDNATPIFIAAQSAAVEAIQVLINAGADCNTANINDATPLYIAAELGHATAIKALLNARADVNKSTHSGNTPLHAAALNGHIDAVLALLESSDSIDTFLNTASSHGATPLCLAAFSGHGAVVKALIAAGADTSKPLNDGTTPLSIAQEQGHAEVADIIAGDR